MSFHQFTIRNLLNKLTRLVMGRSRLIQAGMLAGLLSISMGCRQVEMPEFTVGTTARDLDITMQVERVGDSGAYNVTGRTNLPDNTDLTIAAVRYLNPAQPVTGNANAAPTYAILDYQSTTVADGQWRTTLGLWEIAPDGVYRESWQRDQTRTKLQVNPEPDVHFLVTLAAPDQLEAVAQQLTEAGLEFPTSMLRTTAEGIPYLQMQQTLAIALPSGSTTPPELTAQDINGGWGERYLLVAEPPLPYTLKPTDERQTDSPATFGEYMY